MKKIWLPNTLSLTNLMMGFLTILLASQGRYGLAVIAVLFATLCDLLDGRIARKIGVNNPLGKELDSLADLVSFGVAPGIVFYCAIWGNYPIYTDLSISAYPVIGHILGFLFTLSAAYRLARFNNMTVPVKYFKGIPTTIAGPTVILIILFHEVPMPLDILGLNKLDSISSPILPWWGMVIVFILYSFLMSSRIKYDKAKKTFLSFSRKNSFWNNFINIIGVLGIIFLFKLFILIGALTYTLKPLFLLKKSNRIQREVQFP